jgi:hypothetical protein
MLTHLPGEMTLWIEFKRRSDCNAGLRQALCGAQNIWPEIECERFSSFHLWLLPTMNALLEMRSNRSQAFTGSKCFGVDAETTKERIGGADCYTVSDV